MALFLTNDGTTDGNEQRFFPCLEDDGEMEGKRRAGVGRENWWLLFLDSRERKERGHNLFRTEFDFYAAAAVKQAIGMAWHVLSIVSCSQPYIVKRRGQGLAGMPALP